VRRGKPYCYLHFEPKKPVDEVCYPTVIRYLTSAAEKRNVVAVADALFELRYCTTIWLTLTSFHHSRRYGPATNAEFRFRERATGFIYTSQCKRAGQLSLDLPMSHIFKSFVEYLATFSMLHGATEWSITS
jgi:hypothetical protein